jgi:hypothetical protein
MQPIALTKVTALFLCLFLAGQVRAACPDSIPDRLQGSEMIECIRSLKQEIEGLKNAELKLRGTIAFFEVQKCPEGWLEFSAARGRYVVGLTPGGIPGKVVGQALSDSENRPAGSHTHQFTSQAIGGSGDGLAWDSSTGGPRQNVVGITAPNGSVDGTNAPYLQLLACQKI